MKSGAENAESWPNNSALDDGYLSDSLGEADAEPDAQHQCPVAILIILNPKLSTGAINGFLGGTRAVSDFARYSCLDEMVAGDLDLGMIGREKKHFHNVCAGRANLRPFETAGNWGSG